MALMFLNTRATSYHDFEPLLHIASVKQVRPQWPTRYAASHFPLPMSLIFDLLNSKLLCQLVLKCVTSAQSLNVFRYRGNGRDRRTDERM